MLRYSIRAEKEHFNFSDVVEAIWIEYFLLVAIQNTNERDIF